MISERRDLREMGDHEHLMGATQRAERTAHGQRRAAADACIDLVEHQRRWAGSEYESQGQHCPREFAARCHLGQRQQLAPWVGRQ